MRLEALELFEIILNKENMSKEIKCIQNDYIKENRIKKGGKSICKK